MCGDCGDALHAVRMVKRMYAIQHPAITPQEVHCYELVEEKKTSSSFQKQTRNQRFCVLDNYVKWRGSSGAIWAKLQGSELAEGYS